MANVGNDSSIANSRRRCLLAAVAVTCIEVGFESTDKVVLETLTEMLQGCE